MFPADAHFAARLAERGPDWAVAEVCGLRREVPAEWDIAQAVVRTYFFLECRREKWLSELLDLSYAPPGEI
jgi:hypothetical protein